MAGLYFRISASTLNRSVAHLLQWWNRDSDNR